MQHTAGLFLLAASIPIVSGADWCYESQVACNHTCTGPKVWGTLSRHCNGRAQSPINIITKKILPDERLTPFHFIGYQETFHGRLINNGHNVQLNLPSNVRIRGGNLPAEYKAVQFHLHWGKDGGPGSEHTIDGEHFPMELHIVHIKEEYDSLSEAVRDRAGVAVLGFFFKESKSANKNYNPLINALKYVTRTTNHTTLRGVSLEKLIPPQRNRTKYFRYDGSLTTPDCAEAVVWSLFEDTIPLSRKQIDAFCQLRFSNGKQMVETYRPVQPLNGRQVYYSGGHVVLVNAALLIMSLLLSSVQSLDATG